MQLSTLAKRSCLLLLLAIVAFYFYGLGQFPFVGPDEPRYAQVAREMLLRGDLVTPTLGGHTWFEKPALLYWLIIASFRTFGVSEWSARIAAAVAGMLIVAAVYVVARSIERKSNAVGAGFACWTALITASTAGVIVFSRGLSFDILLTATASWALIFFLLAQLENNPSRETLFLAGFYAFVGLSLLAKGLVGLVIPFGVIAAYFLLRRERPGKRLWLTLFWGVPLILLVASIWYGPAIVKHGWTFVDEFFVQHHFARYLSNKYHHPQRFYFYLEIIPALCLPWIVLLVAALVGARRWEWRNNAPQARLKVFAFAWLVVPVIFFSFSGSKLPGYILPILPASGLLAGPYLTNLIRNRKPVWPLRTTAILFLLVASSTIVFALLSADLSINCGLLISAPAIVAGVLALSFSQRPAAMWALLISAVFVTCVFGLHCAEHLAEKVSSRNLLQAADRRGYASAPVYGLHEINRSAEFYAAGRLVYGTDGEPLRLEGPGEVFAAAWERKGTVLVIVPLEYLSQLTKLPTAQVEVIADNGEAAIVAVTPP